MMKGRPFIGVLPEFRRNAPEVLLKAAREHGDIARLRLGPQHIYTVSNPDWIRDILVTISPISSRAGCWKRAKVLLGEGLLTSEGEFHKRQRRLCSRPSIANG